MATTKKSNSINILLFTFVVIIGLFLYSLIHSYMIDKGTKKHTKAFVLLVNLTFKETYTKHLFMGNFESYAKYIKKNEPTTISYELAEDEKDPLKLIVIERYVNKDAYLNIHKKSLEFKEFRGLIDEFEAVVSGRSFNELDLGFI